MGNIRELASFKYKHRRVKGANTSYTNERYSTSIKVRGPQWSANAKRAGLITHRTSFLHSQTLGYDTVRMGVTRKTLMAYEPKSYCVPSSLKISILGNTAYIENDRSGTYSYIGLHRLLFRSLPAGVAPTLSIE